MGVERVVMGTDFPQLMSVKNPIDFVESVPGLSTRERELILETAEALEIDRDEAADMVAALVVPR